VGSWRSENLGLDFPIWMVDTYASDGSVTTDFFAQPKGQVIQDKPSTRRRNWRIQGGSLEVGTIDAAGTFKRDGQPRPIRTDAAGKVTSVGGWTRATPPASRPASP
jgi:hypothetical protein